MENDIKNGANQSPARPLTVPGARIKNEELKPKVPEINVRLTVPKLPPKISSPPTTTGSEANEGRLDEKADSAVDHQEKQSLLINVPRTSVEVAGKVLPARLVRDPNGTAYFVRNEDNVVVPLDSRPSKRYLRGLLKNREGKVPSKDLLNEIVDELHAIAEDLPDTTIVSHRVAPRVTGPGIIIDQCNPSGERIIVSSEGFEVTTSQMDSTLFCPAPYARPLPYPADQGSLSFLRKTFRLDDEVFHLLVAWITYTLALPKEEGSNYVFLVLKGQQGTGKSLLSKLILQMIDPSDVTIQRMPTKAQDLAVLLANTHVLCIDNARGHNANMSDDLCQASSGSAIGVRQLYTNFGMAVQRLHGAILFNGIHNIVSKPDLAQRTLTLSMPTITDDSIRSEREILDEFHSEHPKIYRYLLDLISGIFKALPTAKVLKPERMIEFVMWVAAYELAEGLEAGSIQKTYSDILKETQTDTLMDNALAAAIVAFCEQDTWDCWDGTPTELLDKLTELVNNRTMYSREWPTSPSALGKRLVGLTASLSVMGIQIHTERGRTRRIHIFLNPDVFVRPKKSVEPTKGLGGDDEDVF